PLRLPPNRKDGGLRIRYLYEPSEYRRRSTVSSFKNIKEIDGNACKDEPGVVNFKHNQNGDHMASKKKPKIKGLARARRIANGPPHNREDIATRGLEILKQRQAKEDSSMKFLVNTRKVRASAIILEFGSHIIDPMVADPDTKQESLKEAITMVITCWNMATFPEGSDTVYLARRLMMGIVPDDNVGKVIDDLVAKKRQFYTKPEHQFIVKDHFLDFASSGEAQLSVMINEIGSE
ncbi:MAG: hypothetical protein AAF804_18820, partial [Bacteroidota bacterium]